MRFIGKIFSGRSPRGMRASGRVVGGSTRDNDSLMLGLPHQPAKETDIAHLVYDRAYQTESRLGPWGARSASTLSINSDATPGRPNAGAPCLLANARRANQNRDWWTGLLRAGLGLAEAA